MTYARENEWPNMTSLQIVFSKMTDERLAEEISRREENLKETRRRFKSGDFKKLLHPSYCEAELNWAKDERDWRVAHQEG